MAHSVKKYKLAVVLVYRGWTVRKENYTPWLHLTAWPSESV